MKRIHSNILYILLGVLFPILFYSGCKKNTDPVLPTGKDCPPVVSTRLSSSLFSVFAPTGFWAGSDRTRIKFSPQDSCFENSYMRIQYVVGSAGFIGWNWIKNNDFKAYEIIPKGLTKVSYSVRATPGFKATINNFPNTVRLVNAIEGTGKWVKFSQTFDPTTNDTLRSPMSVSVNKSGANIGDTLILEIKNIIIE
jgi:hypothetical protein